MDDSASKHPHPPAADSGPPIADILAAVSAGITAFTRTIIDDVTAQVMRIIRRLALCVLATLACSVAVILGLIHLASGTATILRALTGCAWAGDMLAGILLIGLPFALLWIWRARSAPRGPSKVET